MGYTIKAVPPNSLLVTYSSGLTLTYTRHAFGEERYDLN